MMIMIAGAGLAGLSTAFHLGGRDFRIIEREDRPGGLCRTERRGPYSFDYGGHLLHVRGDYVRGLALDLLGPDLPLHSRRAAIFSHGVMTPYPFQVNTHGLPAEVVRDCLVGFVDALVSSRGCTPPDNFFDWIMHVFGPGFARHFFVPFNRKFFKTDLREITDEWVGWSIPRPSLSDVVNGALGIRGREFGYNAEFYYPAGGIEELPKALSAALSRPVECGVELCEVHAGEKLAVLSTGERVHYDRLVSTLPLDRLISIIQDAPEEAELAGRDLRVLSVLCLNLGIRGPALSDQHWIYVPEPGYSFHRIGCYSNFMEIPEDRNSLYLEITIPGPVDDPVLSVVRDMMDGSVAAFQEMPMFDGSKHVVENMEFFMIEHGYVIYDRHRRARLPGLLAWLRGQGIEPAGRYARWEYSTMEDAILEGKETAENIAARSR